MKRSIQRSSGTGRAMVCHGVLVWAAVWAAHSGCDSHSGGFQEALDRIDPMGFRPDLTPETAEPQPSAAAAAPIWLDPMDTVDHPALPGTWGFGDFGTAQEEAALEWVNRARDAVGLPWIGYSSLLATAAREHAAFLASNWAAYEQAGDALTLHEQPAEWPGFTGKSFADRVAETGFKGSPLAEVIAQHSRPDVAVGQWLESVYHRLPLLDPNAQLLGFGLDTAPAAHRGFAVLELSKATLVADGLAVGYPANGAKNVPTFWSGAESPQPPVPPGGYPSGPVFTLSFRGSEELLVTAHALLEHGQIPIAHVQLDPTNDPHLSGHRAVVMYAHAPLRAGTEYKVQVQGYYAGQPFSWTSWFRTVSDAVCDPLRPTCPGAQACYLSGADPVCAWPGSAGTGEACAYANECKAGASCVGGKCAALCRLGTSGTESCATKCALGHDAYYGMADWGYCRTPECTPLVAAGGCATGVCQADTTLRCLPEGGRPWGSICDTVEVCRRGSACAYIGDHPVPRCMPLCDARPLAGSGATGWVNTPLWACADQCEFEAISYPNLPELGVCSSL